MAEIPVPLVDQFAEILSIEPEWYTLGTFLNAPTHELDNIVSNYSKAGIMRCYIEVYKCLETRGKCLNWEHIATSLRRMGNDALAEKIHANNIRPSQQLMLLDISTETHSEGSSLALDRPVPASVTSNERERVTVKYIKMDEICEEFESLSERCILLLAKTKNAFNNSNVDIDEVQYLVQGKCGLAPIPNATFDAVFQRLNEHCSILNIRVLVFLVSNLLETNEVLRKQLANFKEAVNNFNSSVKMIQLVDLIKEEQAIIGEQKIVKLKVREFWSHFTMTQFETLANDILHTLYDIMSHIRVAKGCICISWVIPDIDTTKLVPDHSLELFRIIGVISLHIGDDVIYNNQGEGCETIEAAMLQAIELKNTRAIEHLLAMGCNPEVATYNGDNAVTTIVNIRESKKSSVDHVCIIGDNEHVEAIVDPSSKPAECSSCNMKEKMNKQLHQENDTLCQEQTALHSLTDQLQLSVKAKDIELNKLTEQINKFESEVKQYKMLYEQECQDHLLTKHINNRLIMEHEETEKRYDDTWKITHDEITITPRELGRGGWGSTFVGFFRQQKVAVKKFHAVIMSERFLLMVHREINIMSRVRHPNISLFIGATFDHPSGAPIVITEIMDTSLRVAYEKNQIKEKGTKLSILRDTAAGLNYLHCHPDEIIHRDVSSANVLLESRGPNKWRAKLSDFGSASITCNAFTQAPGAMIYAAPESLVAITAGKTARHTTKMDVFSYGVLMCEVMTCRFPEMGKFEEMLQSVADSSPPISSIIQSCVKNERKNRPTMEQVIIQIDSYMEMME